MKYVLYKVLVVVLKPIFLFIYKPSYVNVDNIPKEGAIILAGNHTNLIDAALMLGGPKRVVHMMAKKELFNTKLKSKFFRSMGCISVDRSIHDENAKSEAISVLENEEVLGIFPEGTINKTNELLLPFKYGAVSFAKKTNAYIVPFAITGKYKLFKKSIKITYGKPYKVNNELDIENKKLMEKVKKLMIEGDNNEKK